MRVHWPTERLVEDGEAGNSPTALEGETENAKGGESQTEFLEPAPEWKEI